MKILIAEDDEDILEYYKHVLASQNHEIISATTGRKAFELAQSEKFDLIITDYKMPGMSGIELLGRIKARKVNQDTPFVVLSGALDDEACNRFNYLNVADIIHKPVSAQTLLDIPNKHRKLRPKTTFKQLIPEVEGCFAKSLETILQAFDQENTVISPAERVTGISETLYCSSVIAIYGRKVQGSLSLTISQGLLKHILDKTFFGIENHDLEKSAELVGELLNQVLGDAKRNLAELKLFVSMGIPASLQVGSGQIKHFVSGVKTRINFTSDSHEGFLEICLGSPAYEEPDTPDADIELFGKPDQDEAA